jgi:hypothetical protein
MVNAIVAALGRSPNASGDPAGDTTA